jgi:fucose 4-O-acetylase-like acetyltransferase
MNLQMLLFKAFAIIDVVLRHKHWPFADMMFIASSIPLFLFLSGYFYRADDERHPLLFILKKFKRLMVLYFIYNAIYALITCGIFISTGKLLGQLPGWYNFFIQPFIDGQQYLLSSPLWFIPFFFTAQICFMFMGKLARCFSASEFNHFLLFCFIGLSAFAISNFIVPREGSIECIVLRLMVGMLFLSLGRIFAVYLASLNIYQWRILLLMLGIRLVLFFDFSTPGYSFFKAEFEDISSIGYSIIDIYLLLFLARYLSEFISKGSFLYRIGNNSYHIMANHLMIFFLLDSMFMANTGITPDLSTGYYTQHLWIAYLILAIIVPTYIGELSTKAKCFFLKISGKK